MATDTLEVTGLELYFDVDPNGQAESYLDVRWTITEELAQHLIDENYVNPHIVLIVSSVERFDYENSTSFDFTTRKVYSKPLTETALQYVKFRVAGENIVSAHIMDVHNADRRHSLEDAKRKPLRADIPISVANAYEAWAQTEAPEGHEIRRTDSSQYYEHRHHSLRLNYDDYPVVASTYRRVLVPKEFFAKEPPAWQKAVTGLIFRDVKGVDQCASWWKLIWASLIFLPFQLYGLGARLGTLLYGLFMGKRNMEFKHLLALHPHDFGESLKYTTSFWFEYKNGAPREDGDFVQYVSPLALVIYAVILSIIGLVVTLFGLGTTLIIRAIFGESLEAEVSTLDIFVRGVVSLIVIAGIIFTIWLNASESGRDVRDDIELFFRDRFQRDAAVAPTSSGAVALKPSKLSLDLMAAAQRDVTDIKPDTFVLRMSEFKGTHCKPFSE